MDLEQEEIEEGEPPIKRRYRPGGRKLGREAESQAQAIALRLRCLAEGSFLEPDTWLALFDPWDIDKIPFQGSRAATGAYIRCDDEPEQRGISYNENLPPEKLSRVLCHELSHHLLYESAPFLLFGMPLICRYDDDTNSPSHRIACRVERLILG